MSEEITGPCPSCGVVSQREVYDIGSGPELSCASCEWCWGAAGQDLKPLLEAGETVPEMLARVAREVEEDASEPRRRWRAR